LYILWISRYNILHLTNIFNSKSTFQMFPVILSWWIFLIYLGPLKAHVSNSRSVILSWWICLLRKLRPSIGFIYKSWTTTHFQKCNILYIYFKQSTSICTEARSTLKNFKLYTLWIKYKYLQMMLNKEQLKFNQNTMKLLDSRFTDLLSRHKHNYSVVIQWMKNVGHRFLNSAITRHTLDEMNSTKLKAHTEM